MSNLLDDPEYQQTKAGLHATIAGTSVLLRRSFHRMLIVQSLCLLVITVAPFAGVWLANHL
ncbi:hypothetical protein [Pseudomonas serbica]|jgi:hypothetical protein|uniref:hypothetical protein n=1 Tax=Pseudomonas serbica TaxID=2965074 RepID=UPI00237B4E26|nr:hypothetical protein [Pseudomonas serbica]